MQEHLQSIADVLEKRDLKKAEILIARALKQTIGIDEKNALLIYRARVRLASSRPDEAIHDLDTIQLTDPRLFGLSTTQQLLADALFMRYEVSPTGFLDRDILNKARDIYQAILLNYPNYEDSGWIHYQLGRIKVSHIQIDAAVDYFQKALLQPTRVRTLTSLCYERLGFIAYYEERDLPKARGLLNRAIDTYPIDGDTSFLIQIYLLLARIQKGIGDYESAIKIAESGVNLASQHASQRHVLAEALLMHGEVLAEIHGQERRAILQLKTFMEIARRPVGIDVTWSRVNELLGNLHFRLGLYEEALAAFYAALQHNPDHPWNLQLSYQIGCCHYQMKDYRKAADALQRLVTAAATEHQTIDDYRIFDLLGNALFALQQFSAAAEAYRQALEIAPPHKAAMTIKSYHDLAVGLS